jgi:hypothetical protein
MLEWVAVEEAPRMAGETPRTVAPDVGSGPAAEERR